MLVLKRLPGRINPPGNLTIKEMYERKKQFSMLLHLLRISRDMSPKQSGYL